MERVVIESDCDVEFAFKLYDPGQGHFVDYPSFVVDASRAVLVVEAVSDQAGSDAAEYVRQMAEYISACGGPPADRLSPRHVQKFVDQVIAVADRAIKKKAPGFLLTPAEPSSSGSTS